MSHHPSYTYGGFLVGTGLYAYATKRSVPSLLGGVGLGSAFLLSGYLIQQKGDSKNGHLLATIASLGLLGVGASRYRKVEKKTLPITFMVLGAASLYYQGKKYLEWAQ